MNVNNVGNILCKIVDKDGNEMYKNKYISAHGYNQDNSKKLTEFNKLELDDGRFQHIPNINKERDVLFITGKSGSGKSYYTKNYILEYKKAYPKNKVYLFSRKNEDKELDDVIDKRIIIDESVITSPFQVEQFEDSLVVFDDTDVLPENLKKPINHLRDMILELGRSMHISAVITNHMPTAPDLKKVLNECHSATVFPANVNRQLSYFLENYCGCDKEDIKRIKKCNSRSCTIFLQYPPVIMSERKIWLQSFDDDLE